MWTQKGNENLGKLSGKNGKISLHKDSELHLNNEFNLSILGRVNIQAQLHSAYHLAIEKHNAQVDKNRLVLSEIINCIRFCGSFKLALRGHDETQNSKKIPVFIWVS